MKSPVRPEMPAYLQRLFDKYKYILLVCLVGLVLLLWPQSEPELRETASAAREGLGEAAALETRLEAILETMDGVGKAQVLLTVETGEETIYAFDRTDSQTQNGTGGSASSQRELVTLSESGGQAPVPVQTAAPVYRGAMVVCEGGGSASIRLEVTRVIQSLTGISADRIVISKMKQ